MGACRSTVTGCRRGHVTQNLGDGVYEIEGVRFNMGGWWEFKVTITSERGNDTVTFNLSL
jgi:hypothetical protein